MPRIEFDAALRWARFDPRRTLSRRDDNDLPFVPSGRLAGELLLLDTCVYIDGIRMDDESVAFKIDPRRTFHSTVAVQELMLGVGALDPKHPGTAASISQIRQIFRDMPEHRLHTPDADVLSRAALLCGILSRLEGYARDQRLRLLQDCVLFLQAQKLGLSALTRNVRDFDFLLQLFPRARVLFYRI